MPAMSVPMNAQIGEDVLEAAFDVQALAIRLRQHPGRRDVHGHADGRDDRHERAGDVRRLDQPPDRLIGHEHAEHEQHRAIRLPAQHFGAPHPVGEALSGRPLQQPDHEDRQHERGGVGQHVPASDKSASECATMPTTTSNAMKPTIGASATVR
jgi:hypothetical protein